MADTDLFVAPERLEDAVRALAGLGYARSGRTWKHHVLLRPDNRAVVDPRGEHPDNPRPVELHGSLGEALRGVAWPGPSAREATAADGGDAAALAHVLAHASVDILERRLRLVTLVDVARLRAALDEAVWERALGMMAAPAAARLAWPALALAERELGMAPPVGSRALAAAIRPALHRWLAAVDVDAVARAGGGEAAHGFLELAAVWPLDAGERRAIWRHAVLPGRWQLADRYPALAASRAWPLAYARHAGYCARLATSRIRLCVAGPRRARGRRDG